jgi:hypothetical protein
MKPVKLSELKVGDQVYDIKTNHIGHATFFQVVKIKSGSIYLKPVGGFNDYLVADDGNVRFSIFSKEDFYKLQLSDLTFDHADKYGQIRIPNPDAPGSCKVFTKVRRDCFNEFVAEMMVRYNNPVISVQWGRVTIHSEKFTADVERQNKACQSWCDQNTAE